MALFRSTKNQIAQIVPSERRITGFFAASLAEVESLLRRLSIFAGVTLERLVVEPRAGRGYIVDVSCARRRETIRIDPGEWYFPPSAFVAYLNAKLADAGSSRELVACHDDEVEVVALCEPDEADELSACIFAVDDGMRWPLSAIDETEVELLAAIRASPGDDGPRHVYADWLIERGDPRGHFIVLQCHPDPEIRTKARALLYVHEPAWAATIPAWCDELEFERGFVQRVSATSANLLARHAELFAITPVPDVRLDGAIATLSPDGKRLAIRDDRGRETVREIQLDALV